MVPMHIQMTAAGLKVQAMNQTAAMQIPKVKDKEEKHIKRMSLFQKYSSKPTLGSEIDSSEYIQRNNSAQEAPYHNHVPKLAKTQMRIPNMEET